MPLYTFYPHLPDGNSLSFEAHDLSDDTAAEVFAPTILLRHPTCSHVLVWDGARQVCSRGREIK